MFETKVIGMAPADRLGTIRMIVVLCALVNVVFTDFNLLAQAAGPWFQPEGVLSIIPRAGFQFFFTSEPFLLAFKAFLILFLISAFLGFHTRISLILSTLLYALYLGILRLETWSLDNGILPLYLMFMMIWIPAGEGFSLDQRFRPEYAHLKLDDRPNLSMGWSVFLVRAVLAFCYFQSGMAKLENTGLGWIQAWRLKQGIIEDSLAFSHQSWIPHLLSAPAKAWMIFAAVYWGLELLFPAVLVIRELRTIYLWTAVIVRGMILFPQNIFFHDLILLQFIFYDWDRILPLREMAKQDRRKGNFLFRLQKFFQRN